MFASTPEAIAKANVKRWFSVSAFGPVFIPGSGGAIPLDPEVASAMRAEAVTRVADATRRRDGRMMGHAIAVVVVFMIVSWLTDGLPPALGFVGDMLRFAVFSFHGLLVVFEAVQWERGIFDLRDELASRLTGKTPYPEELVGKIARPEPNWRLLQKIAAAILIPFVIWKALPLLGASTPGGLALPSWIPGLLLGALGAISLYTVGITGRRDAWRRQNRNSSTATDNSNA